MKPAKPVASAQGGTRPSATLVICSRDMTAASDQALLRCNALVTDASAQPGSRAPAGKVTWETEVGTLDPADCMLTSQGGTSSCVVALTGSREDLPIGSELPVTAFYAGDALYAPSDASHRLFGKATGFTESDQYGPDCNPAAVDYPSMTCGDPVNPATGNLSMTVADVGISGRGFALAVVRTYNAHAAADGAAGRFGIGWTDEHEGRIERAGKRVTVHLGTGATVPFQVKGKRFTAPGWVTASLTQGKRKGYLLTLSDQTRFTFDAQGRLTSFSDRNGEPIAITRAADGAILTAADSSGRTLTFERDGAGRVTTVTDPMGRSVAYVYDETGHLVSVTDVAGSVTRYAYDEQHRMTGITDQRGSTATTEYDADDRVVRQTDPLGNAITFEYAGTYPNGVTPITDGKGIRTA
ncbi:MAG: DUF6531 domain-containing protein, partial [Chloroflexi bacterium]|nr:DUF6531 domain-containing protein [Chloroflexota bacterium]